MAVVSEAKIRKFCNEELAWPDKGHWREEEEEERGGGGGGDMIH